MKNRGLREINAERPTCKTTIAQLPFTPALRGNNWSRYRYLTFHIFRPKVIVLYFSHVLDCVLPLSPDNHVIFPSYAEQITASEFLNCIRQSDVKFPYITSFFFSNTTQYCCFLCKYQFFKAAVSSCLATAAVSRGRQTSGGRTDTGHLLPLKSSCGTHRIANVCFQWRHRHRKGNDQF